MAERADGTIRIAAAPAQVLAVIGDFESYPAWAAAVRKASVLERGGDGRGKRAAFEITTPMGDANYTLDYTWLPDGQGLAWDYVEGSFKDLSGAYELAPDGDGTKVTYRLAFDIAWPVPGLLKRQAAKQVVRTALDELKRRVEQG